MSSTNWGRWGQDDQLGALNLMTPERIVNAVRLVKKGNVYNLAVPLDMDGPQYPSFHKTLQITYFTNDRGDGVSNVADDLVTLETHSGTHIDALGHFWSDQTMWNGRSADNVTSRGLNWGGIHNVRGLVARGIMLDIAAFMRVEHLSLGEVVTVETMEECARSQNVKIERGDVLLVRTGWYTVFEADRRAWEQGEPGPDVTCAEWLREKDVMALGADNAAIEAYVYRDGIRRRPCLHTAALRDLGVYLIEHVNLEDLARDRVYEFLFVAAPLRLTRATGAPFSPLALV